MAPVIQSQSITAGSGPTSSGHASGQVKLVCCLTLYNEHGCDLAVTVASIIRNADYWKSCHEAAALEVSVCIIADGREKLSETANELIGRLGLSDAPATLDTPNFRVTGLAINNHKLSLMLGASIAGFEGTVDSAARYRESLSSFNRPTPNDRRGDIHVFLSVNHINQGKLTSHSHFFNTLCPLLGPDYCVQIDAGTVLRADSLHNIIMPFQKNEDVAAVSSLVLVGSHGSSFDWLDIWQVGDFIQQKLIEWPAEAMFGYLAVIPGQFSAFRWSALTDKGVIDKRSTPLDRYFRGLRPLGPVQANMFMAEDRVLGFEVFAESPRSLLHYEPSAIAITDACSTLGELLRQRRRWINSSFACNLWMLGKSVDYLSEHGLPLFRRFRIMTAAAWLTINNLYHWFMLGLAFLVAKVFVDELYRKFPRYVGNSWTIALCVLATLLLCCFARGSVTKLVRICCGTFCVMMLVTLSGSFFYGDRLAFVAFILEPIILFMIVLRSSHGFRRKWHAIYVQYIMIRPVVLLVNTMYAVANINKCNWGTKGLEQETRMNAKTLNTFRAVVMLAWLASNVILVKSALPQGALNESFGRKSAFVMLCTLFVTRAVASIVFVIVRGIKV